MGMRATIGYIDTDNSMKLTSVQWSTMLDRTLGFYASKVAASGNDPVEGIHSLVKNITERFWHIGALEVARPDEEEEDGDTQLGHNVYADLAREREGDDAQLGIFDADTEENQRETARNFHLNGGSVGVIVDANDTDGTIELFYDNNETDELESRVFTVSELAEYYEGANEGEGVELMELPFRQ